MNILEIIEKKRDGKELSREEIRYFVQGYTNGTVADYQAAALIMAIYINDMNGRETTDLTLEMASSGDILDLSRLGIVVDKHSTGGVGDKVTLIVAPIVASLGVPVAKMSGRGLGFTGGTIDKLESIPGYKTEMDIHNFVKNVENIGISIIGQTLDLAPADKKMYALRDTINCVGNKALIASSIMSKKIAAGANKLVLEVTCGNGAFMKNKEDAIELSNIMKEIGILSNKETVCIITNMNEPLGYSVGNILEVKEAIEFLRGNMCEDVKETVLEIGAYIIKLSGKGDNLEENKKQILTNIENGEAYRKFLELVENQGGDVSFIEDTEKFPKADIVQAVSLNKEGYIQRIDTEEIGNISVLLGAGRIKKEDKIDNTVGIILNKKVGDKIEKDDVIAYIHSNDEKKAENAKERLLKAIRIVDYKVDKEQTILGII